jgi:hypothetical protein
MACKDGCLLYFSTFCQFKSNPNVSMLRTPDSLLILVLYVDDLLIIGSLALEIVVVKDIMHDRFSMTGMGPLHYFLGLKIIQDASCINLSQTKYVRDLLVRFHMTKCRSTTTPFLFGVQLEDGGDTPVVDNILYRHLVGSLLYPTHTQSYLSYAVGEFFRYMQESHELHWKAVKCILIYVQGTTGYGIHYAT